MQVFPGLTTNYVYGYYSTNYIVAGELRDLTSETTYHVRCVATNRGGITYGTDSQFRTTDLRPIILGVEGSPLPDGAILRGIFSPNGSSADAYFQYGPTTNADLTTPVEQSPAQISPWTYAASLTGLAIDTTYFYRLVASNSHGIALGKIQPFRLGAVNFCSEEDLQFAMQRESLIEFNCDGVITLTNPLVIARDTVFDASARSVTISGGKMVPVFLVNTNVSLSMTNLIVANGRTNGFGARGGGIHNAGGRLYLVDCVLTNLWALGGSALTPDEAGPKGGAIFNAGGDVVLSRTLLTGNGVKRDDSSTTDGFTLAKGGAICSLGGRITLNHCRLEQNLAFGNSPPPAVFGGTGMGGAVFGDGATISVKSSRFVNNVAGGLGTGSGYGGACAFVTNGVALNECLFDGNSAFGGGGNFAGGSSYGGAVLFCCLNAGLTNCTFSGNKAHPGAGYRAASGAYGGAIHFQGGVMEATHLTIVSNEVPVSPTCFGSNLALDSGSRLRIRNSIIANPALGINVYSMGEIVDDGGNLQWPVGSVAVSIASADPQLGPLADNGGPTLTHALLPGSPAIDGTTNETVTPVDQRGYPRPIDGNGDCLDQPDIGAYEVQNDREASALSIEIIPGNRIRLHAVGIPGRSYKVYAGSGLLMSVWSSVASIACDDLGNVIFEENLSSEIRFYRIAVDCHL